MAVVLFYAYLGKSSSIRIMEHFEIKMKMFVMDIVEYLGLTDKR